MIIGGSQIIAPVSVDDIKAVIAASVNDVGSLCTHANINMWSKYKPFSYQADYFGADVDSMRTARLNALRAQNCALNVGTAYRTPDAALDAALLLGIGGVAWSYVRPDGSSVSPYRLADFDLYNHASDAPFRAHIHPKECYAFHTPAIGYEGAVGVSNINFEDLLGTPNLQGYYIGVAWRRHGLTTGTMAQTGMDTMINTAYLDSGVQYDVCAILSPRVLVANVQPQEDGGYYLAPIPLDTFIRHDDTGFSANGKTTQWPALGIDDFHIWSTHYASFSVPKIEIWAGPRNGAKTLRGTVFETMTNIVDYTHSGAVILRTPIYDSDDVVARIYTSASSYKDETFNLIYSPT